MQIGHKHQKTIQQYRHNIKLLKYHLKKQQRINQTLKYKHVKKQVKGKDKKTQQKNSMKKQRIYSMNLIVSQLTQHLKRIGLNLGDVFRMADNTYSGQINKAQFLKTINQLKSQIKDDLINQMFYAIDTNLNQILDQDQYTEFLCAYGGGQVKQTVLFQKKSLDKFVALLKKKNIKYQKFYEKQDDPIHINDFQKKLIQLSLNNNQAMILIKLFDPSTVGSVSYEIYLALVKNVKQKNIQDLQNQKIQKNITQLCIKFRQLKINPIKIFQQADSDKKDGVSPDQLQQAFKKLMPGQTEFQIKKWVEVINYDKNQQITRSQFSNALRSIYALNQIQKFSIQYDKLHPKTKKQLNSEEIPVESIIKKLQQKIQDLQLSKKEAFDVMDTNKNHTLDKQQLAEGLKKFGLNIMFIGSVLAVFDRSNNQTIQLNQWLRVLGKDVKVQKIKLQEDFSDDQSNEINKSDFQSSPSRKNNNNNKNKKQSKDTKLKQKINTKQNKVDINKKKLQTDINKNKKQPQNNTVKKLQTNKKVSKNQSPSKKNIPQKKIDSNNAIQSNKRQIFTKQISPNKPKSGKQKQNVQLPKQKQKKKQQQQKVIKKIPKVQVQSPPKQKKKILQEQPQSNVQIQQQQQNYEDQYQNDDIQKYQKLLAIEYKKTPNQILMKFKNSDMKNKKNGFLQLKDFIKILDQINTSESIPQEIKKQIFMAAKPSPLGINYQEWLNEISQKYEQQTKDIKNEEKQVKKNNEKAINNNKKQQKNIKEQPRIQDVQQVDSITDNQINQNNNSNDQFFQITSLHTKVQKKNENKKVQDKRSDQKILSFKDYLHGTNSQDLLVTQYKKRAQQIKNKNKIWVDKSFPANVNSILSKPNTSKRLSEQTLKQRRYRQSLKWKHYSQMQIFKNPVLFQGKIQPNDIKQGSLGNCYFLSALACLAEYPNLIERLFQYVDIENGYFLIWLCIDGIWKIIQVDGYIVVCPDADRPAFSLSNNNQLWVILLQKAYAKAYGTYQNIEGGLTFQAVKDLSGSPGQDINHKKVQPKIIWQKLFQANQQKFIMAAGTQDKKTDMRIQGHQQNISKQGIVYGHAYSILDLQQIDDQKIIQLRNPWGKTQWKGDWADDNKKWTPELKRKLNYQTKQDGIFWMPFSHFLNYYGMSSINYLRQSYHYESKQVNYQKEKTSKKVKQFCITFQSQFKSGYLMISFKDLRHDYNRLENASYVDSQIISLACKNDKVIKKIKQSKSKYQRQLMVSFSGLNKGQIPVVLVSLSQISQVNVSFYCDKKCAFKLQLQSQYIIKYYQGLSLLQQNVKGKKQSDFIYWMTNIGNRVFYCFKNISQRQFTIRLDPDNVYIKKTKGNFNDLTIPKGEIRALNGQLINRNQPYGFKELSFI